MDKWHFSAGRYIGKSHDVNQDNVRYFARDGVIAVTLSDGCSSSHFAYDGSRITVETVGELLTSRFDEIFALENPRDLTEAIVKAVYNSQKNYVLENEAIQEQIHLIKRRKRAPNQKSFDEIKEKGEAEVMLYYLSELFGTLLFVAMRDEKILYGQIGDGYIGLVLDNKIIVKVEEDKRTNPNPNSTWYPTMFETLLRTEEALARNPYPYARSDLRRVFKSQTPKNITGFILMSDGNDGLIYKDPHKGKRFADDVHQIFLDVLKAKTQEERDAITEAWAEKETTLSVSGDDCSIGVLVHESFKVDKKTGFVYIPPETPSPLPKGPTPPEEVTGPEEEDEPIFTVINLGTRKKTTVKVSDYEEDLATVNEFEPEFMDRITREKNVPADDIKRVVIDFAAAIRAQITKENNIIDIYKMDDFSQYYMKICSKKISRIEE